MKPEQIALAERVVWVAGFVAVVVALVAVDWRLGALTGGVILMGSTLDIPWRRS
jgi:hypothetical protein